MDGVKEDEVTRDDEQEEHLGGAMIGSWREKKKVKQRSSLKC